MYRALVILNKQRCQEVSSHLSRKVSRKTPSTDAAIQEVSRNEAKTQEEKLDPSTSYRGFKNVLNRSTSYLGSVEITIRKKAWKLDRQPGVKLAFKNSFSRREKHRHECNQAHNSTKDPISNLNSQNHLSITILSIQIPHTKQV